VCAAARSGYASPSAGASERRGARCRSEQVSRHGFGFTRRCFSMRHSPALSTAVLLLQFLGGIQVTAGDDKPMSKDLGRIQPPGGVPLPLGGPGTKISVDFGMKASKRLEAAPAED